MHEVGIMHNLLERAVERAKQEGATHINAVHLRVGQASEIGLDALDMAFEISKHGTIAEKAQLEVEYLPVVCYCAGCNSEFEPVDTLYECPDCHQSYCEVRQGKELELAFLDVS
jgi:hydrogenase nickel incorporation protein HypA/HybF